MLQPECHEPWEMPPAELVTYSFSIDSVSWTEPVLNREERRQTIILGPCVNAEQD